MKTDDFEKQLQEQPMRQVPGHWRGQILQAAKAVKDESRAAAGARQNGSWIYQLLWPCPQAWGALAAIWVVVLFLSGVARETSVQTVQIAKIPDSAAGSDDGSKTATQVPRRVDERHSMCPSPSRQNWARRNRVIEPSVRITMVYPMETNPTNPNSAFHGHSYRRITFAARNTNLCFALACLITLIAL